MLVKAFYEQKGEIDKLQKGMEEYEELISELVGDHSDFVSEAGKSENRINIKMNEWFELYKVNSNLF